MAVAETLSRAEAGLAAPEVVVETLLGLVPYMLHKAP